jgi:hypothetical protein
MGTVDCASESTLPERGPMLYGATTRRRSGETRNAPASDSIHAAIQERFTGYLAGTLAEEARCFVAAHLAHCARCSTALVSSLQATHRLTELLGALPHPPAPVALRDRLLRIPDREGE